MARLPKNLLCLSHLRWDFVYQRPQHLLTRFSEFTAVYFLEEPVFGSTDTPYLTFSQRMPNLWVCVPHLPARQNKTEINDQLKELLKIFFVNRDPSEFIFWYYTPMALEFSSHIKAGLTVYDCMDELSAFKFAPDELKSLEKQLFNSADIVFTGGHSLYESKKMQHYNIHPFPSSIDKTHFSKARIKGQEPDDQANITGPKIGFYGVIDERFDSNLIQGIADARPDWNIILIGPIVKIDPNTLPKNKNVHYLGSKSYDELPKYLSGWEVAMVPFVLNESTRFISPTKTPEYLCGGVPVVSTAIKDVINPYAKNKLVSIGVDADDFVDAIEILLTDTDNSKWLGEVDQFLASNSWDITCSAMTDSMLSTLGSRNKVTVSVNGVSRV